MYYAFRFSSNNGTTHEESKDDGEHGTSRMLLNADDINKFGFLESLKCHLFGFVTVKE